MAFEHIEKTLTLSAPDNMIVAKIGSSFAIVTFYSTRDGQPEQASLFMTRKDLEAVGRLLSSAAVITSEF